MLCSQRRLVVVANSGFFFLLVASSLCERICEWTEAGTSFETVLGVPKAMVLQLHRCG